MLRLTVACPYVLKYGQQGKQPQSQWNVSCGNRIERRRGRCYHQGRTIVELKSISDILNSCNFRKRYKLPIFLHNPWTLKGEVVFEPNNKRTKKITRATLIHVEIIDFLIAKRQPPTYVSKTDSPHVNLTSEKIRFLLRHVN